MSLKINSFSKSNEVSHCINHETVADIHVHFTERMLSRQLAELLLDEDNDKQLDLTIFQVVPPALQTSSLFFEVIKSIAKEAHSYKHLPLSRLKHGLYKKLAIEQDIKWAQDFNDQMLSLYETLGAGTSLAPSADDFPIRRYKAFAGLSDLEAVIMQIIESEEIKYKFAEEIRDNRKREEERQYEEYKLAIEQMKAKRAAK